MFASGYGPAEALAVLRYTVYETIEPSEYSTAFVDRAILPSIYYVDKYDISLHTPEPIKHHLVVYPIWPINPTINILIAQTMHE